MIKKLLFFCILLLSPFIVLAYPLGDVNGNNKVDNMDYVLIRNHIRKTSILAGDSLKRADVNSDNKINNMDYVLIRNIIAGKDVSVVTPTAKPKETATPTPTPTANPKKYTVSFIGGDIIKTGYEGNEVLIKGGKVSTHSSLILYNKKLNLSKNQKYAVSFDYQTRGGKNKFDVDIYPDKINQSYPKKSTTIQVNLEATNKSQNYVWIFASNDSKIAGDDVTLRFFDDIRGSSEKDISITNILMSKVTTKEYIDGDTLGTLDAPKRTGYKFLGWYTSPTGGEKVTKKTTVTKNMTLYARWGGYYEHVFIIGIDGLGDTYRPDKQKSEPNNKVDAKNFRRIFGDYAYRYDANTENITISAQNWTSIFTGVTCESHGITNSIAASETRDSSTDYPTIFYYVKKQMPNAKMTSIVNWNPINHGIIETDVGVDKIHPSDDVKVTNKVVSYVKNNKNDMPTLMFVHLCDVDHAAHATQGTCATCGGYSQKYYDQAQVSDTQLGKMYDAIDSIGLMDKSLFIVVADHGEAITSHGSPKGPRRDPEEDHVVVAVRGYTVNKMTLPTTTHNRDVSAIVLYALGIDKPENFISTVPAGLFKK